MGRYSGDGFFPCNDAAACSDTTNTKKKEREKYTEQEIEKKNTGANSTWSESIISREGLETAGTAMRSVVPPTIRALAKSNDNYSAVTETRSVLRAAEPNRRQLTNSHN